MTTELTLLSRVAFRGEEVTAPRMRGLLALLARDLHRGSSTARLVDGLWPDEQPGNPTKALQILVSRARAQLGSDVIASTPTGYRLCLTEDQVDTAAVQLSATAAAQRSRAGDHAAALTHAEAGLALFDGRGESDGRTDDPVSALRAERAPTHATLVRARALSLSRLGRRAEAVEVLADVMRARPRDEEVMLELLRCEAATAGPSTALATYDTYRRSLRDELGSDPGAELQALHQQLLQGETPVTRRGIPYEPNELLGRADDVAAVAELLRTSRVASIVGAGGLGKTRLAHVVSRQAEQRVVHFVALAGVGTDGDVAGEVASVLGVGELRRSSVGGLAAPRDVLAGIVDALAPGPALLVLDNCEHVVPGAAELVRALVLMTGDVRVLTTSRAPLGLSSESVYLLPELGLSTAVELFGQRARAARPGVDLPAEAVEDLCRHLDGLPLAVELAAARARVMSVPEIARRLDDRFALLRGGARDTPQRHRTLEAVVDWSWNLLDPADQAAMRALSVFPGGFTADAAEHLLGGDVVESLEHLVDQSLLQVTDSGPGTRFRMLETVREFSTTRREEAGETGAAIDGLLAWAIDFGVAQHESVFGPDPYGSGQRIRVEQDNLAQALRHGLARDDGRTVAATSAVLWALCVADSNYSRMAMLVEETAWCLSHVRPEPELVEVMRTASTLSTVFAFLFQSAHALRALATLRRLPPAPSDTMVRAFANALCAVSDPAAERSTLEALSDSDEPLLAGAANGIATYRRESEGDLDSALVAARRMLDAFDDPAHPWMRVMTHSRIGELCMQLDLGDEARRHVETALLAQEELGEESDPIGLRWALVLACLQLGDLDGAEQWLELAALHQRDEPMGVFTYDLAVRAELALARAEVDAGLRLWRGAVERVRNVQGPVVGLDPVLNPWVLELQAGAVIAHAQHGRLDLVEEMTAGLPDKLSALLADPSAEPTLSLMDLQVRGALLLALAWIDIDRGETRTGARMIALAERFRFLRNFQPTMSPASATQAAVEADRSAYDDAVSSYADLGADQLRTTALAELRARQQG